MGKIHKSIKQQKRIKTNCLLWFHYKLLKFYVWKDINKKRLFENETSNELAVKK